MKKNANYDVDSFKNSSKRARKIAKKSKNKYPEHNSSRKVNAAGWWPLMHHPKSMVKFSGQFFTTLPSSKFLQVYSIIWHWRVFQCHFINSGCGYIAIPGCTAAAMIGKGNVLQNEEIEIFGLGNKTGSYCNGILEIFASVRGSVIFFSSDGISRLQSSMYNIGFCD